MVAVTQPEDVETHTKSEGEKLSELISLSSIFNMEDTAEESADSRATDASILEAFNPARFSMT
jgi:hypothetical protein